MNNQHSITSKVFLILSLLLLPILYFSGMTYKEIGSSIYVYFVFAVIGYQLLHDKHIYQMVRVFGLAPLAFCILMTPVYFLNHLYHGTLLENAHSIGQVFDAWFDVMLRIIAIGYLHVLAILMLFVMFYLFGGIRRNQS